MDYKSFSFKQVYAVFGAVLGVGLFNGFTDPYGLIYEQDYLRKPRAGNHSRLIKSVEVVRVQPRNLILGTSRMGRLNPENAILQRSGPTYNLSLAGSSIYEQRRYLEHTIDNQSDLEVVIIGLDFFAFSEDFDSQPGFINERLGRQLRIKGITIQDWQRILFSLDAFGDSWETLVANVGDYMNFSIEGEALAANGEKKDFLQRSEIVIRSYLERDDRYKNYQLGNKKISEFRKIVQLCQANDIELVAIIPPVHATQLEAIFQAGLWDEFMMWKEKITSITAVWDFSSYGEIVQEPLKPSMNYYQDSSHFKPAVADLMLKSIFEDGKGFGVILTADNVYEQNQQLTKGRKQWIQNSPDDQKFVEEISSQLR